MPVERALVIVAILGAALLLPTALAQPQGPPPEPAVTFMIRPLAEPPMRIVAGEWTQAGFEVRNGADTTQSLTFATFVAPSAEPPRDFVIYAQPTHFELAPRQDVVVQVHSFAPVEAAPARLPVVFRVGDPANDAQWLGETRFEALVQPAGIEAAAPVALSSEAGATLAGAVAAAGAGAAAFVGLRRVQWIRVGALGALLPLYSRLAPSRLLEQERRDAIHQLIANEPGIHFSALLTKTGLASGVLVHHLRMLEKHGLIKSRREGALRRYAVAIAPMPEPRPTPMTPMQQRVLAFLSEAPRTQREIAETFGLSQQGANRHVKALERRGALAIRYEDGVWRCHALAGGPTALPAASTA